MIDLAQFNGLDWAIIVVLSLSILLSLWRGFAREAMSLAGWVAAYVIANLFVDELASLLGDWIVNITGRYVVAYAMLFVGTLVIAGISAKLAKQLVKVSGLTVLDRLLGTVFGFARGVILVLVFAYIVRQLLPAKDLQWLHESVLMPHLDMLLYWTQMLFSQLDTGQLPGIST